MTGIAVAYRVGQTAALALQLVARTVEHQRCLGDRADENFKKTWIHASTPPCVKSAADFWAFSHAGRALADLHVGYESAPEYAATIEGPWSPSKAQYRVGKMKFGKGEDKSVIHNNDAITLREIPLAAYEYVVNGKPAIEWVMERQSVTTDKASGIVKDANAWATETVRDARYPLSLLLR